MKTIVSVGVALALASLVIALVVHSRAGATGEPVHTPLAHAPAVETPLRAMPEPSESGFIGVVVARDTVDVTARSEGLITAVRVRLGDRVARNDLLAQLDDHLLKDELAVAQATLTATRAEEEKAALELQEAHERNERNQKATGVVSGAMSQEELATARYQEQYASSRLSAARARVQEQQARVIQLEQRIRDEAIRAPFDGVVTTRYVDGGATVTRGTPIVRLVSSNELWVRFAIPENQGSTLSTGLSVDVRVKDLGLSVPGLVEKIAPEVDSASRMIVAEARLLLPPERASGLSGRVVRVHPAPAGQADLPPTP